MSRSRLWLQRKNIVEVVRSSLRTTERCKPRPTSCMFPKKELNEVQMKRASIWPLPRESVLVSCLPCWFLGLLGVRFLGCLTTTVSVIRVLASGGCEIFDASRTLSLINANLGSKDLQSEVTVVAKKIFEEVVVSCAGRNGALLGSGSGPMRRLE